MDDRKALAIIDKIFEAIFEEKNNHSLDKIINKYAFDIKLPQVVYDATTNEQTWTSLTHSTRYMTNANIEKRDETTGWMQPKKEINSLEEVIELWKSIDYSATERVYNSENVIKSDPIYRCENVYQCTNCGDSKNIIFCDGCYNSTYTIASQRSNNINFCIRVDDSNSCSNSYSVICSNKISNSFFIQDCSNLLECMFCSHISNKSYCIANMQFEKEEYFAIKEEIIKWILNS